MYINFKKYFKAGSFVRIHIKNVPSSFDLSKKLINLFFGRQLQFSLTDF